MKSRDIFELCHFESLRFTESWDISSNYSNQYHDIAAIEWVRAIYKAPIIDYKITDQIFQGLYLKSSWQISLYLPKFVSALKFERAAMHMS